jgi:GNAT superfamily N-acetyltransferase
MEIIPYHCDMRRALAELWYGSWAEAMPAYAHMASVDYLHERLGSEVGLKWRIFLAREDDSLLGFVALDMDEASLKQLFVATQHQGRGIGGALLRLAKATLPHGMTLEALDIPKTREFYERNGFRREGTVLHAFGNEMIVYRWKPDGAAG